MYVAPTQHLSRLQHTAWGTQAVTYGVSKDDIKAFLEAMRKHHENQIAGMELPTGTRAFLDECVSDGNIDTLEFMLKLSYLMGLQTGFAASQAGDSMPDASDPFGPIKA